MKILLCIITLLYSISSFSQEESNTLDNDKIIVLQKRTNFLIDTSITTPVDQAEENDLPVKGNFTTLSYQNTPFDIKTTDKSDDDHTEKNSQRSFVTLTRSLTPPVIKSEIPKQ